MKRYIKFFTVFTAFLLLQTVTLTYGVNTQENGDRSVGTNGYVQSLAKKPRRQAPLPPVVPVTVDKYATPVNKGSLANGENPNAWDITLKISSGAITVPVDVVMVIDQSSSMSKKGRIDAAIKSGQEFVRKMLPKGKATDGVRIALVSYDHQIHRRSDFTKDADLLCSEIRKLEPIWGTHTQAGLKMAREIMKSSTATKKYIILMSDGNATQQFKIKNPQTSDFMGMTGNPKDPTDIVIDGGVKNPKDFVAAPKTGRKPQYPTWNSKVSKPDLPESKYDYGNLMDEYNFVAFEGTSGPLVWEPKLGKPYYYYAPTNAAINEAKFAKDEGYEIFTIGYDLEGWNLPIEALRRTATDDAHFIEATPEQLAKAFNDIAETINKGVQKGAVVDLIAPGFILKDIKDTGDVTDRVKVSHGTVTYDKSTNQLKWTTGAVLSSSDAILTYRVYANLEDIQNDKCILNPDSQKGPDVGGFDTNKEAILTYTNSNGEPNKKLTFPRPTVKTGYGVIKRHYILVDSEGHLIKPDGSIASSLSEAMELQPQDYFLPAGKDHIAPKWIKMDKKIDDLNNQKFSVNPSKDRIKFGDEYYRLVETSVSGSTPKGGKIGISWKKPIGTAYFAYVKVNNYWIGGTSGHVNEWNINSNWTDNRVPLPEKDIEFATAANNNGKPAKADLHLDHMPQNSTDGRVIGNLINASDKNLVITNGNQLTINGKVIDGNPNAGTIVVKASTEDAPTGTLKFAKPADNKNVDAIVEFYSKAYDCVTCGMYRRSWQYFGIPVLEADFPKNDVKGDETINQWVEPFNGNKWQTAPYRPDTKLQKFKGYEITNSSTSKPREVYKFKGKLYVGDADVSLTKTSGVNYAGANLVGNSYTAAIHIKKALVIPNGVDKTVYLFNTGTRDQWRKLDGSTVPGYQAGQYLAVPQNTAGSGNLSDRIPSMQTFMLLANNNGASVKIKYDQLVKNTKVNKGDGTQIGLRSADENNNGEEIQTVVRRLPSLQIDVMGEKSADRVWLFQQPQTTHGFDDGWDGRKITEEGIVQLYVAGTDNSQFQVATVPETDNVKLGFTPDAKSGRYTLNFLLSEEMRHGSIYFHDIVTGAKIRITNGATYTFEAGKEDPAVRFRLSGNAIISPNSPDESLIQVVSENGKIKISNASEHACSVFISNSSGMLIGHRVEVEGKSSKTIETSGKGVYIVRLQNAVVNDIRRVTVR
ncbi:vWA domain-containing protein [Porphyromonas macacae]|uniref:vWA domain-containing protein n=1 Tax=Porphyromonas macacae TaxID=28115 RepID=UPI00068994E1|nr:vWA domain-containing protein [Porphyromonas macacae]